MEGKNLLPLVYGEKVFYFSYGEGLGNFLSKKALAAFLFSIELSSELLTQYRAGSIISRS